MLANRKISCIYAVLANKKMHFPMFLCLYELFWKGFESVNIAGDQIRLLVWRVVNIRRSSFVSRF